MSSPVLADLVDRVAVAPPHNELLREAAEAMLDGFAIFSAVRDDQGCIVDFRYEYINARGAELNRRPLADHQGHTLLELLPAHRGTELFDAYVSVVVTGQPVAREALDYEDVYGGGRWLARAFDLHAVKLGDGFAVTWRDVTAQKQAEQALQRRVNELSILNEIARVIAVEADLGLMLRQVGATAERLFDQSRVALGLLNADRSELRFPGHFQRSSTRGPIPDRVFPLAQHPSLQAVLSAGRTLTFDQAQAQPLLQSASDLLHYTGAECMMLVPLQARGEAVGVMTLWSARPGCVYTPVEVSLAETVGGQIADAVETRRLFEAEQRQRRMAESLREIALALIGTLDEAKILGIIFEQLQRVIAYEGAGLMLIEGDDLVVSQAVGLSAPYLGWRLPLAQGLPSARVFQQRTPLMLSDTQLDAAWIEHVPSSSIRSWLGAPLVVSNQAIGVLSVVSSTISAYSVDQGQMLQAFATQAAIAIEHARLYQRAQSMAIDAERQRLARELHDSVAQELYSVTLMTNGLRLLAEKGNLDQVTRGLQDLHVLAKQALRDTRLLTHQLRPSLLKELGLLTALKHRLAVVEQRAGLQATLTVTGEVKLSPVVEEHLFQIAQEALNNALRHAQASRVDVTIVGNAEGLTLTVADNGIGFEPDQVGGGLGLVNLRERATIIGAHLSMTSQPERGTTVEVRLAGV